MRIRIAALALLVAACSSAHNSVPQNNVCVSRCETKEVVCGVRDNDALARCGSLCAAKPTADQLTCLDGLACAELAAQTMPCGILVDAGASD